MEERRKFKVFPTIFPDKYFHAVTDAKIFHRALEHLDLRIIINNIFSNRSSEQLRKVEKTYKKMYDVDLKKQFEIRLVANRHRILLGRFYKRYEYQAY